jgi:hypothetical protein
MDKVKIRFKLFAIAHNVENDWKNGKREGCIKTQAKELQKML